MLGPWPLCWFCPPGSNGWILPCIPSGIYPGGGPPTPLPTPFPPLTVLPNGDPEYSSQESCRTTATATDVTFYVSYATDTGGATTATSTVSTDSSEATGCMVVATTVTTTVSASSTYNYCTPAATQTTTTASKRGNVTLSFRELLTGPYFDATLIERDIPNIYEDDGLAAFYDNVESASDTVIVEEGQTSDSIPQGISTSGFIPFANAEANILVAGLRGCTSVVVVNQHGAYVSHLWEGPYFYATSSSMFQSGVLDYLRYARSLDQVSTS